MSGQTSSLPYHRVVHGESRRCLCISAHGSHRRDTSTTPFFNIWSVCGLFESRWNTLPLLKDWKAQCHNSNVVFRGIVGAGTLGSTELPEWSRVNAPDDDAVFDVAGIVLCEWFPQRPTSIGCRLMDTDMNFDTDEDRPSFRLCAQRWRQGGGPAFRSLRPSSRPSGCSRLWSPAICSAS